MFGGRGDSDEEGEEVCDKCAGWYSGGPFMEVLECAPLAARDVRSPLRISVTGRNQGTGTAMRFAGRVEQGVVEIGTAALLEPCGVECGVQAIEVSGREVCEASAGELVHLRLLGGQPTIGQVLCSFEEPMRVAVKFKAQIRFVELGDDIPIITPGFRCVLHLHTATVECEVSKLIEAVDPRTKKKEAPPKFVKAPMVALCVIVLTQGVAIDASGGRFSRFSLRNDGGTIAIGKVAELPKLSAGKAAAK
jgi:peptide chain release factor subunit 3